MFAAIFYLFVLVPLFITAFLVTAGFGAGIGATTFIVGLSLLNTLAAKCGPLEAKVKRWRPCMAAFFPGWDAVRLYQSPSLTFALTRSIPFILASGVAAILGVSVYAATTDGDRLFPVTVIGLLGLPMLAISYLWKLTRFKKIVRRFRDGRQCPLATAM